MLETKKTALTQKARWLHNVIHISDASCARNPYIQQTWVGERNKFIRFSDLIVFEGWSSKTQEKKLPPALKECRLLYYQTPPPCHAGLNPFKKRLMAFMADLTNISKLDTTRTHTSPACVHSALNRSGQMCAQPWVKLVKMKNSFFRTIGNPCLANWSYIAGATEPTEGAGSWLVLYFTLIHYYSVAQQTLIWNSFCRWRGNVLTAQGLVCHSSSSQTDLWKSYYRRKKEENFKNKIVEYRHHMFMKPLPLLGDHCQSNYWVILETQPSFISLYYRKYI